MRCCSINHREITTQHIIHWIRHRYEPFKKIYTLSKTVRGIFMNNSNFGRKEMGRTRPLFLTFAILDSDIPAKQRVFELSVAARNWQKVILPCPQSGNILKGFIVDDCPRSWSLDWSRWNDNFCEHACVRVSWQRATPSLRHLPWTSCRLETATNRTLSSRDHIPI